METDTSGGFRIVTKTLEIEDCPEAGAALKLKRSAAFNTLARSCFIEESYRVIRG